MFIKKLKIYRKLVAGKAKNESGAALAIAIIMLAILSVIALTALAFSSTEARIAGSDLQRSQTFYATVSSMEKMTNDFSNLFRTKLHPTQADLDAVATNYSPELTAEGFSFDQGMEEDADRLNQLRALQNLPNTIYPRVNIPDGPYAGLYASIVPYKMHSTGTLTSTKAQVELEREFNNYLVPIFQFGIYSNDDLEFSSGPLMTFNGRVHSNGNIYALRNIKFLNRVSTAGELVREVTRGGDANTADGADQVWFEVNGINVQSTKGSVTSGGGTVGGPNFVGSSSGQRGYYPGSPNGIANPSWESTSIQSATGAPDNFGGQVLTGTTGATQLKTPLELAGNSPAEIIKRALPTDTDVLSTSRYHSKSQIRILIDGDAAGSGVNNVAGIPAGEGVQLQSFVPSVLNGGNVLRVIGDDKSVGGAVVYQRNSDNTTISPASVVRGTQTISVGTSGTNYAPPGAGITGRILIEVVKPDGTTVDVTQTILSMGVTEGEPNGIVYLQRPLWASLVQGSRDRSSNKFDLVSLTRSQIIADGEITPTPNSFFDPNRNFISGAPAAVDDDTAVGKIIRELNPPVGVLNSIVPINVYNVREGWVRNTLPSKSVYYERGVTSVVELNMRNLARWVDGIYDTNLLSGTNAVSANIKGDEGYVVYVSDRRGDMPKAEYNSDGTSFKSTNGTVDNEDIYGPNNTLDSGEDVIDYGWDATQGAASKKGTLQKDTSELPDLGDCWGISDSTSLATSNSSCSATSDRFTIGINVMKYSVHYFRRAVRLFDAETLSISPAPGKLSPTKGITIASENMVYTWGNYNTTGVTSIPAGGSTLNDGVGYDGAQVPSSIVCDAIFPLSKTWFDALSAMYPEGSSDPNNQGGTAYRMADDNLPTIHDGTAVRAGLIAGTNLASMTATPGRNASGSRRNGGIVNYPRFLEIWNAGVDETTSVEYAWSYTGSFIPLFNSTQAISQWENDTSVIYMPPRRNWSFDATFLNPNKLPPGTPFFQYVQGTGFRQVLN